MNLPKEFATEWAEALESGNYAQGPNALAVIDAVGSTTYCCLGVACSMNDIPDKDLDDVPTPLVEYYGNILPKELEAYESFFVVLNDGYTLSYYNNWLIKYPTLHEVIPKPSTNINDKDYLINLSFTQIAKIIRHFNDISKNSESGDVITS